MTGKLFVGIGLCLLALGASAQNRTATAKPSTVVEASPETLRLCKLAEGQIEDALKAIAFEGVAGILDNSAPRESNRQLRITAATMNIQVQQIHMNSLGCPAIQWTLAPSIYGTAPMACALASGESTKEKCDRKLWVRTALKLD
jgi:hypothetical protein